MAFLTEFAVRIAPMRVRFGTGAALAVAEELTAMGNERALLISTASQELNARAFATLIGPECPRNIKAMCRIVRVLRQPALTV